MQYAKVTMIVAVEDEIDSPISCVVNTVCENLDITLLEYTDDNMYLMTTADFEKHARGRPESERPPQAPVQWELSLQLGSPLQVRPIFGPNMGCQDYWQKIRDTPWENQIFQVS